MEVWQFLTRGVIQRPVLNMKYLRRSLYGSSRIFVVNISSNRSKEETRAPHTCRVRNARLGLGTLLSGEGQAATCGREFALWWKYCKAEDLGECS